MAITTHHSDGWTYISNATHLEKLKETQDSYLINTLGPYIKELVKSKYMEIHWALKDNDISIDSFIARITKLLVMNNTDERIKDFEQYESELFDYATSSLRDFYNECLVECSKVAKELVRSEKFLNSIGQVGYKLHLNLPLSTHLQEAKTLTPKLMSFFETVADAGIILQAKLDSALNNEKSDLQAFSRVGTRFQEGAQITVYLSLSFDKQALLKLIKDLNTMAAENGIPDTPAPEGDEKLAGIVSFRLDFDVEGDYLAADLAKDDPEHLQRQKEHEVFNLLRLGLGPQSPEKLLVNLKMV